MTRSTGQSLTEYAFAGAVIAVICIGVLVLAGGSLLNFGQRYSSEVYSATGDKVSFFGADTSGFVDTQSLPSGPGGAGAFPRSQDTSASIETNGGDGLGNKSKKKTPETKKHKKKISRKTEVIGVWEKDQTEVGLDAGVLP